VVPGGVAVAVMGTRGRVVAHDPVLVVTVAGARGDDDGRAPRGGAVGRSADGDGGAARPLHGQRPYQPGGVFGVVGHAGIARPIVAARWARIGRQRRQEALAPRASGDGPGEADVGASAVVEAPRL